MALEYGRTFGTAGGGLIDAKWAANSRVAEIGREGELATANYLDRLALQPGGATVLHDLSIPIPGIKANIDHVVVAGNRVQIIDTKMWAGGFYWNLGGPMRGWKPFNPMGKKTMQMAFESLTRHLAPVGKVRILPPLVVVRPSGKKPVSLWAASMPGAKLVQVAAFEARMGRLMHPGGKTVADPAVVQRLLPLLNEA